MKEIKTFENLKETIEELKLEEKVEIKIDNEIYLVEEMDGVGGYFITKDEYQPIFISDDSFEEDLKDFWCLIGELEKELRPKMEKTYLETIEQIVDSLVEYVKDGRYTKFENIDEVAHYIDGELYSDYYGFWYDEFLDGENGKNDDLIIEISRELSDDVYIQEKIFSEIIDENVEKILIE